MNGHSSDGPLAGVRVLEFAALGPCAHCGMMLADMGAQVVVVDRPEGAGGTAREAKYKLEQRGRSRITLDLKNASDIGRARELAASADMLIEAYRPGTMERLGLGPTDCHALNARLIYGRLTGWGQDGPLAHDAGHDINYMAASGLLNAIGPFGGSPCVPLNVIGDFGGGSMLLAYGLVCALFERERSGMGQVLDASMTDGIALLVASIRGMHAAGRWRAERGTNAFDGGLPWYDVYPTADGRYLAVGALESKFYAAFLEGLGLAQADLPSREQRDCWPGLRTAFRERIRAHSLVYWTQTFASLDACVTPVLDFDEAVEFRQFVAREAFEVRDGVWHPRPAPRFSRTPGRVRRIDECAPWSAGGISAIS